MTSRTENKQLSITQETPKENNKYKTSTPRKTWIERIEDQVQEREKLKE